MGKFDELSDSVLNEAKPSENSYAKERDYVFGSVEDYAEKNGMTVIHDMKMTRKGDVLTLNFEGQDKDYNVGTLAIQLRMKAGTFKILHSSD
jgi:hypothetical protein